MYLLLFFINLYTYYIHRTNTARGLLSLQNDEYMNMESGFFFSFQTALKTQCFETSSSSSFVAYFACSESHTAAAADDHNIYTFAYKLH